MTTPTYIVCPTPGVPRDWRHLRAPTPVPVDHCERRKGQVYAVRAGGLCLEIRAIDPDDACTKFDRAALRRGREYVRPTAILLGGLNPVQREDFRKAAAACALDADSETSG